jgi:hypothetical protein
MTWEETRLPGGQENPVAKAVKQVQNDEQLITKWSPALLQMQLDQLLWKDEPHIGFKRVWECLATYLYMPRLRNSDVLLATVQEGVQKLEWFGYADSVDEDGRYVGLQFGYTSGSIYLDDESVLVKPSVAAKQLEAEVEPPPDGDLPKPTSSTREDDKPPPRPIHPPPGVSPKRFYGTVELDPIRASRDAQQIVDEVVQHLTSLPNATVEVTIDIRATASDGFPEGTVHTVTENCRTLKFTSQDFEEE